MGNSRVLVIGFGNPLRGDDGLGPAAIEALQQTGLGDDVTLLVCHQLTPDLAEPVSRADLVILIDAAAGDPPGQIDEVVVPFDEMAAGTLHHHVSPQALLGATRAMYGRCPEMVMLSINAASFEYGAAFSPPVEAALPAVLARIRQLIAG